MADAAYRAGLRFADTIELIAEIEYRTGKKVRLIGEPEFRPKVDLETYIIARARGSLNVFDGRIFPSKFEA